MNKENLKPDNEKLQPELRQFIEKLKEKIEKRIEEKREDGHRIHEYWEIKEDEWLLQKINKLEKGE